MTEPVEHGAAPEPTTEPVPVAGNRRRPSRVDRLADAMPDWMGSIRFRLTAIYSLVLFGLAAVVVAGIYLAVAARLHQEAVANHDLQAHVAPNGGIILPDTAKEKPKQGRVISLGDGKLLDDGKRAAFQVKAGDRVLFTSYAGNEVPVDGKEYLIMTEDDLLAVVD